MSQFWRSYGLSGAQFLPAGRTISFDLPAIESAADLPQATEAMLRAVASGEITPSEAADIGKAVPAHIEAITAAQMADRLARLEEATG